MIELQGRRIEDQADYKSRAAKKEPFHACRRLRVPHCQRDPERKFRQSTNCETAEYPQSVLGPKDEQDIACEKPRSASDEQKPPWSNTPCCREEQGKDQIELDQHGEIPPRRV